MRDTSVLRVYFGGKFKKENHPGQDMAKRLRNDYRAILLGDPARMVHSAPDVKLDNKYIYAGPFYCEQASNGDFTSTECNIVATTEAAAVANADIFIAVFDESCAVGTVVELGWAINWDKDIYILYKRQDCEYSIKSEYWFAIIDAQLRAKKVRVFSYDNTDQVIEIITNNILR